MEEKNCVSGDHFTSSPLIHNLPYVVMVVLGALIVAAGSSSAAAAWTWTGAYVGYSILGPLWIILFLCPHCPNYGRKPCPCGYGAIAARLRQRGDPELFAVKFKRHIPVIFPVWVAPTLVGGILVAKSFSPGLGILVGAFAIDAFLILPLVSKIQGCKECPQRETCPWMNRGRRRKPAEPEAAPIDMGEEPAVLEGVGVSE